MQARSAIKALGVVSVTALLATACVGGGNSSGKSTAGANKNTSKNITIMTGFTGAQLTNFEAAVNPYAASQGIKIQWQGSTNFNQLINTRVQGGNPPDIALFPQPGILDTLGSQGKLIDLSTVLDMPTVKASMVPGTLDAGSVNGKLYGLEVSMNVKSIIYYPKQAFQAAGYTVPKSISELLTLTNKIKADGKTPWCQGIESGAATGWPATDWIEQLVLNYGGIDTYNQWVAGKVKFNSPVVKQAANTFAQIAFTSGNTLGGRKAIASTNFATAGNPMFKTPPGCFLYKQGNFVVASGFFPDSIVKDPDASLGVMPFPPATAGGPNPVEGGGDLAGLFSGKNASAIAMMKYMSTKDFGAAAAKAGGYLSPHKDFDLSNYPNQFTKDVAAIPYKATVFAFDGSDAMPGAVGSGSFWKEMTSWVADKESLDTALKNIDKTYPTS
jgi:alpha-glucoside transport system substrate-binding protein